MLEGERDDVLDTFKRGISIGPRKPFGDRDSDSSIHIGGVPGLLFDNLRVEGRETEVVLVPVAVDVCDIFRFGTKCTARATAYSNSNLKQRQQDRPLKARLREVFTAYQ